MPNLKLKISATPQELEQAQRLRFDVFDIEIKGVTDTPRGQGVDKDEYDDICEHLLIIDTDKSEVIGTYRMLLDSVADAHFGFYTETKFNLEPFKKLEGVKLEVGRSCVHKDYRDRSVLNLMWHGIADYAKKNDVRYIFGSSNIMTDDIQQISRYFSMFKQLGLYEERGIDPIDAAHVIEVDESVQVKNPRDWYRRLPVLFKGYMNIGLKVCGRPSKGDFGTALFPVVLDIRHMNKIYKRRFFANYLDDGG